ncbi:E3 ubiquitin-protein ligase TRIM39-like [Aulostomus maculatus]
MAQASSLSEEQFWCPICLDVFTDPVATPCGHNFCKTCITTLWDVNMLSQCPVCNEVFFSRPMLQVNTLISQMVAQVKHSAQPTSRAEEQADSHGDIFCDVCRKTRASKSCLVCLTSYCLTHLEPHLTATGLKSHQLVKPVGNLHRRLCMKHERPLELFCKEDQICICMVCVVLNHRSHDAVPLKNEYDEKKAELEKMDAKAQQMIQDRREKIQELKRSMALSSEGANREEADGVRVLKALRKFIDRSLDDLTGLIQEKQRPAEKLVQSFISELEQEISELMDRSSQLERLSRSEDHLQLLQSFPLLNVTPPTKDWTTVSIRLPTYEGTVMRVVSELEKILSNEMKNLFEQDLKRVQQYTVGVTLDPDTANPWLVVSDDGKRVNFGAVSQNLPDNPRRFTFYASVLGKQSFTSGRFYYEVQVKGKTKWDVGVVRESVNRKKQIIMNPQNGYWTISLRNRNEYKALADPRVRLSLKSQPQRVGVFVDHEGGVVSFYNVETAALLYTFTGCSFTEKLYPFFNPCNADGKNSVPLIVCSVQNVKFDLRRIYDRNLIK